MLHPALYVGEFRLRLDSIWLAPALKAWNANPQTSLKEGARSTSARPRAQSSLVIVQMALTLVLLEAPACSFAPSAICGK